MSKLPDKNDLAHAYIACVTRHTGPDYAGFTLRKLRLTKAQIEAATVSVEEPEIPGIVAGKIELEFSRFVETTE